MMVVTSANSAALSCVADPHRLTFKEMIDRHKTGKGQDHFFLGKVMAIRDLEPGRGGDKIAKVVVRESPVGRAPLFLRLRFWAPPPGVVMPGNFVYRADNFYAVVAKRFPDGTFDDDHLCGQTSRLTHDRFWRLVRYAER